MKFLFNLICIEIYFTVKYLIFKNLMMCLNVFTNSILLEKM